MEEERKFRESISRTTKDKRCANSLMGYIYFSYEALIGVFYLPTNVALIAFFNYYYTFLQLDPDDVLSQISVLGSVFLAILPAGPAVIEQTTQLTAFRRFAGTSVVILVGCATDTARKVQAEIISRKFKNIEFYDIDKYVP